MSDPMHLCKGCRDGFAHLLAAGLSGRVDAEPFAEGACNDCGDRGPLYFAQATKEKE